MNFMSETTPAERARWATDRTILTLLREEHGADAVVERPIRGMDSLTQPLPKSYLQGIKAARLVAHVARGTMIDYARKARGAGVPWESLAEPLGIEADRDNYESPAEKAFELVATKPSGPFDARTVGWDCGSCGKWITDRGPYDGHPDDCETGHAEDCARHLAELEQWRREYDDPQLDAQLAESHERARDEVASSVDLEAGLRQITGDDPDAT